MKRCNPENERIKREYFEWMNQADRKSCSTVDIARKAIYDFEVHTTFSSFKSFNKHQAIGYKKNLFKRKSLKTGKALSISTIKSTLHHVKKFFKWLAFRPGYRRIDVNQIEYFNLTEKESREATGGDSARAPTLEQIKRVIDLMPATGDIQLRDRAIIACTILTGIRDGALISLRLKHVKLEDRLIVQNPKEVKTKNSKLINTFFFPIDNEIESIFIEWVEYLLKALLFNEDAPLFPKTKMIQDENNCFKSSGVDPVFWTTAAPIREVFKEAFENAGLEYYSPHSFRKTLTRLGEKICRTPEEFKAWSQNLGHEQVLTTFTSYGNISQHSQGEIISSLSQRSSKTQIEGSGEKLEEIRKIVLDR